jgi:AbrB family looped-hinge helix DNA binding protein
MTTVKVSSKYRVTIPQLERAKLNIKQGDLLTLDVQDGLILLFPQPKSYADYLHGLHGEIWKGIDVDKYLNGEHKAWEKQRR